MNINSNQLPHLKPEPTNQVSAKLEVYLLTFLNQCVEGLGIVFSHHSKKNLEGIVIYIIYYLLNIGGQVT